MGFRICSILLAIILEGCTSPSPALYTLEPVRGTARAGAPATIVVRVANIPRYLEREEIVRTADHGRVVIAENDWWSEPLKPMLQRVMAENIAERLPASDVLSDESVLGAPPDVDVVVSVGQLDRNLDGQVTLTGFAAFRYREKPRHLEPMRIVVKGVGQSTADQVGTTSLVLAKAADVIAASLAP